MSPDAPGRPCAGGCGTLVRKGRCSACARPADQRRGTASQRGYDAFWLRFRKEWLNTLVVLHGILPVCGAAFPDGPPWRASACADSGLLTFASADGSSLHLDHVPELEDHERRDRQAVCDPLRIVLLCATCHNAKTARSQGR